MVICWNRDMEQKKLKQIFNNMVNDDSLLKKICSGDIFIRYRKACGTRFLRKVVHSWFKLFILYERNRQQKDCWTLWKPSVNLTSKVVIVFTLLTFKRNNIRNLLLSSCISLNGKKLKTPLSFPGIEGEELIEVLVEYLSLLLYALLF